MKKISLPILLCITVFIGLLSPVNTAFAKNDTAPNGGANYTAKIESKYGDTSAIDLSATYNVLNRKADIFLEINSKSTLSDIIYLKGKHSSIDDSKWSSKGKSILSTKAFTTNSEGYYSILVKDKKGHTAIYIIKIRLEFRAVWYAYYDYYSNDGLGISKDAFIEKFTQVCQNVKAMGMNAIIAHVRAFSDAMYKSKYYPWSKYASGTQGKNPGYDPLKLMVKIAHEYDLELHAWLNPYRVSSGTDISTLSKDNPAKVWLTDKNKKNDRNVLFFGGKTYYNPSSPDVIKLIINGTREIVKNYDVDGIHIDDYFYPEYLGTDYKTNFDAPEYKKYKKATKAAGKKPMDIVSWRRNNVNKLVKGMYNAIKKADSSAIFGVSPGGFLDYLTSNASYYVDYPTWLSNDGYMDYICPQIYWSFSKTNSYPFTSTMYRWINSRTDNCHVQIYAGIGAYKCGLTTEKGWTSKNILRNMIKKSRQSGKIDGMVFFDYSDMISSSKAAYVKRAVKELLK